ncbi:hypothetical protein H0E87_019193 [Populus deltoides]|uniref:Uncharacterized protein n=1 Tax=Populus deltoides TaxID=3696 RepID=A0A8T2XTA5_POPDE|nr:hypothetical protein H0E87_019193 [Populus deltoides]
MEESRKEDLSRWIRMAIEDKRGWCDMEIKELGDDVDKVTVLTDNQTSDRVGLKGKGTMVLSHWSRDGFGSKCSILGILLSILRRSYRVIRRFKCKVSFSICDVVANPHDRPQACSAQKSDGFMGRQHTCPLCIQGVILLVSLVCLLR